MLAIVTVSVSMSISVQAYIALGQQRNVPMCDTACGAAARHARFAVMTMRAVMLCAF